MFLRGSYVLAIAAVWGAYPTVAPTGWAATSDEQATALAGRVAELIARLDAPRLADRDAAEKALVAIGPDALDVLPRGEAKLSAEVKQRLTRVRRQLEIAFAKSAAKASLITLADGERPFSEVLAAIAEQSGNPLVDGRKRGEDDRPPADPRIRIAFDKTPFWQALDETLDAAGMSLNVRDAQGDEPLRLVAAERRAGLKPRATDAVYRGPLRFAVAGADVKRDADEVESLVRIVLEAAWEPRLRPVALNLAAKELSAVDDQQRPLRVASAEAQWATSSLGGQGAMRLTLPFVLPNRDAKHVVLRGRMTALLAGSNVAFRFERLRETRPGAAVVSQKVGDATVRLESFRRVGGRWIARIRVIYDNPQEAVQSHYDWLYESRATLAAGAEQRKPVEYDAQAAEDGVIATYVFAADDADKPGELTLIYATPAVIMTVPFEFEFAEIALPR